MAPPFPIYRGVRYIPIQSGNGFLNVLSKFGQSLIPTLVGGAGNFISGIADRASRGESLKDAAAHSAKDSAINMGKNVVRKIRHQVRKQHGSGTKRRKVPKRKGHYIKRKRSHRRHKKLYNF